ncbi:glycosyltransferase family 4 protein [Parabacteroides segnis]|uniref:glycosyltransferase family 4 protein n=1 Tax=Parabacteroides segnis TaxID=2763058 RepID=UPI003519874C
MKKVICFHLYNDYSGSPKVLSLVVRGLVEKGYSVELYTSNTDGFLIGLEGVVYHQFRYNWTKNKIITLLWLLYAQMYMFFSSLKYMHEKDTLFYVNTICPVGAVFSAVLCNIPVIYHVHEKYVNPNILHRFYELVWRWFSTKTIFVSKYLQKQYFKRNMNSVVVYNALSDDFLNNVKVKEHRCKPYNILMICSLKHYKGVHIFVELAKRLPQYRFTLIVNGSQDDTTAFFSNISTNLTIYPAQKRVFDFLYQADLLLNLSIPSLWIETFGLTLLEAMSYGVPVISPPAGGPVELVENDYNGFLVDSRDIEAVIEKIIYIFESGEYERLSKNAKSKSLLFDRVDMINKIEAQIKEI